ncbi:MAG: SUMF1/EgtB/PvdO family nonheme iron enzyme [Myxococcota bacterium]|nr:SUMF1/EgtB/PvdO family nonheme iron enzyme [Myxococcota bacterium]
MNKISRSQQFTTSPPMYALWACFLCLGLLACSSSGGNLSDIPGIDAGEPTCGQCPEGEQCHPEARICVPCPNGECAQGVDAGDIIPVIDQGTVDGGETSDAGTADATSDAADVGVDAMPDLDDSALADAEAVDLPDACMATGDETCDGIDNDCDDAIDEVFDTATDLNHCGGCGQACEMRSQSNVVCTDGECLYSCQDGWIDADGMPDNGCESSNASVSFTAPNEGDALRDDFTIQLEIVGDQQIAIVELKANDQLLMIRRNPMSSIEYEAQLADMPQGTVSLSAEFFDLNLDSMGRVTRMVIIDGTNPRLRFLTPQDNAILNELNPTATIDVTNEPGPVTVHLFEVANDVDELIAEHTQNGSEPFTFDMPEGTLQPGPVTLRADAVDEAGNEGSTEISFLIKRCASDEMVDVLDSPNGPFRIDRYEASLFDATPNSRGTVPGQNDGDPLICSRAGVIPWYGVLYGTAYSACEAIGKRLCTQVEFEWACGTAALNDYPYGTSYRPSHCNGADSDDFGAFELNNPELAPTGFMMSCFSRANAQQADNKIYDLSGNLAEWTTRRALDGTGLAGGHYDNDRLDLKCNKRFTINELRVSDVFGFRCCQSIEN